MRAVFGVVWASTEKTDSDSSLKSKSELERESESGVELSEVEREEERQVAREMVERGLGSWVCSTGRGGSKEGRMVPDGLRYHVLDVWVDELEGVFGEEEAEEQGEEGVLKERRKEVLEMVMPLVERMSKEALTKGVRVRAKEVLADERLKGWI